MINQDIQRFFKRIIRGDFILIKILAIIILTISTSIIAQDIEPRVVCVLPGNISEASGIEISEAGNLWLINDSGNPPAIYEVDSEGQLLRTLGLKNAPNIDFEELCKDEAGNMYIGDFGNNLNDRRDLTILKLRASELENSDSLEVDKIRFDFPDQNSFPPAVGNRNFDCEAMFHYQNSLYLFSKNRDSETTRLYKLPDSPGTYTATLVSTFNTGGWITAADISPNQLLVALLSEDHVWVFYDFLGDDFFSGQSIKLNFDRTQKEALVFDSDQSIVIADERENEGSPGQAYTIDFADLLLTIFPKSQPTAQVIPNPIVSKGLLCLPVNLPGDLSLTLYDPTGSVVKSETRASSNQLPLDCENLLPGVYMYEASGALGERWTGRFVVAP